MVKATCCWCAAELVQAEADGLACWLCPRPDCTNRQAKQAVVVTIKGKGRKCLFVPVPKQVEMWECTAKNILWGGAAGPGKSTGVRWWLYRCCLQIPGFEALLLRENYKQLLQTHIRRMESESRLIGADLVKSEGVLRFPNGSLIQMGHMEDADAVQNYLSTEYDAIVADEGSQYPITEDGSVPLLELSTRARSNKPAVRDVLGGAKFVVASNPGGPTSNALLDVFVDHQPDFEVYPALKELYDPAQFRYIPATLDDNPYIDPDYLTTLALLPKWRYEQLRHGDWRVFAGQFFSQWRESHHVADLGTPEDVRWFRSMDWGRNQPGCVLWWAVLPDHRLYLRAELKFQGMDEQEVAQRIHAKDLELGVKPTYTAGDPAVFNKTGATHNTPQFTGQSIGETLGYYGIPITKADNDRVNGWGRCHALLRDAPDGTPWLLVHPDCRYLIRSIPNARSAKNDPDDVDTKMDDHALDALRYGCMSRPSPAIYAKAQPVFAPGTMGALRMSVRPPVKSRLGSESVYAR